MLSNFSLKGKRIIDLGCGSGQNDNNLSLNFDEVVALDLNRDSIYHSSHRT